MGHLCQGLVKVWRARTRYSGPRYTERVSQFWASISYEAVTLGTPCRKEWFTARSNLFTLRWTYCKWRVLRACPTRTVVGASVARSGPRWGVGVEAVIGDLYFDRLATNLVGARGFQAGHWRGKTRE